VVLYDPSARTAVFDEPVPSAIDEPDVLDALRPTRRRPDGQPPEPGVTDGTPS
jgi:hypothetical protein